MFIGVLRRHPSGEADFMAEWEGNPYPPLYGFFWSQGDTAKNGRWEIEAPLMQNSLAAAFDQQWYGLCCSGLWTF